MLNHLSEIVEAARSLRSAGGSNTEYDRALVELATLVAYPSKAVEVRPYLERLILEDD